MASRAAAVLAALAAADACGGGQTRFNLFSTNWEDDGGASIDRVWRRMGDAPIPAGADVVIGVAGNSDKMIGMPLDGGDTWTFAHALDARPTVAGGVVVASGGGEVFALDAKTGAVLWKRPTGGLPLLGAGDDGTVTVVTFRRAGATGSMLLAVARDGDVVRQIETEKPLGTPAVLGRMAFVPWAGQYVSVLDLSNGDETARVTLRDETNRAWTQGGALWFGQGTFIRFDGHIRDASKGKASTAAVKLRELPGGPKLMRPGNVPLGPAASAEDKVRAYARPAATDEGAAIEDERYYATYFRIALGLTSAKGSIAWAHLHDADFVGGAAAQGGVVLCDEKGKVLELDAKGGGVVKEASLGEPVKDCVVNVDEHRAVGAPAEAKPLATQLADVVRANDAQLAIAQKLLLGELAALEDEAATRTLVEVSTDPRTSPDLLTAARAALMGRRNGARYLEAALERHYDYLKDVLQPPPVEPIAQALAAMKDSRAAPLLASHLLDPADTDGDVKQAAAALAVVAGSDQLASLQEFFAMYRATAANEDVAEAVVNVGRALLRVDPRGGRAAVEAAVNDATTVPYAREKLAGLLKGSVSARALDGGAAPPTRGP
jgi:outer membrane protein assembly factor BamB